MRFKLLRKSSKAPLRAAPSHPAPVTSQNMPSASYYDKAFAPVSYDAETQSYYLNGKGPIAGPALEQAYEEATAVCNLKHAEAAKSPGDPTALFAKHYVSSLRTRSMSLLRSRRPSRSKLHTSLFSKFAKVPMVYVLGYQRARGLTVNAARKDDLCKHC